MNLKNVLFEEKQLLDHYFYMRSIEQSDLWRWDRLKIAQTGALGKEVIV